MRPFSDDEIETVRTMIAAGHTARDVADRLGRTRNSIIALSNRRQLGPWKFSNGKTVAGVQWKPDAPIARRRVAPVLAAEIETIRKLIAERKSAADIGEIIGRTKRSVIHIVTYRDLGPFLSRSGAKPRDLSIIPEDFARRWETTTQTKLRDHFRVSKKTISVWVAALGLVRDRADWNAPATRLRHGTEPMVHTPRTVSRISGHKPAPFGNTYRDPTTAGQAADTLRKDGWKVHRCNAAGIYDPAGSLWQCGRVRVTEAELLQRAERVLARQAQRIAA